MYVKKRVFIVIVLVGCLFSFGRGNATEQEPEKQEPEKQEQGVGKQELLDRIEELEKRINEMSEESRARRKLEITEQEKQEKEKEVLEAVSREYSLNPRHSLGLDYALTYSYTPSEKFYFNPLMVEREIDHSIEHSVSISYSILDNLAFNTTLPFVYRYDKVGTDKELDETDLGDISAGITVQPVKSGEGDIRSTVSFAVNLPSGRSPYEINPETELSTGSGLYAFSLSGNFSRQIDPVVAFWNIGYTHRMTKTGLDYKYAENVILEKVDPGDTASFGAGLGYALSYKVSVNASFSYSYNFSTGYHYEFRPTQKSGDSASASVSFGMGWKVSNKTTLSFGLRYGLTGSGFELSFRVPFTFVL